MRQLFAFSMIAALAMPAVAQVKIAPGPEKIAIEIDGKPFSDFFIAGKEVSKPYLFPIRAASGTYITRMWPLETVAEEEKAPKDHPHQRGLWFAHAKVNNLDFWNIAPLDQKPYNQPDRGKIVLKKVGGTKSGKDSGTIAATFDWTDVNGKLLLTESRVMTFYADPKMRTVDFDITLTAVQQVTFGDEKDGLFGIRLRPEIQEEHGSGVLTNAEGLVTEKQLWGKPSKWCDYSGEVKGEKLGVAILDHPQNPRYPVRWHARGYGLFSANPFGVAAFTGPKDPHQDMVLEPGKSLRFRYRVVVHGGDAKSANLEPIWEKFSKIK